MVTIALIVAAIEFSCNNANPQYFVLSAFIRSIIPFAIVVYTVLFMNELFFQYGYLTTYSSTNIAEVIQADESRVVYVDENGWTHTIHASKNTEIIIEEDGLLRVDKCRQPDFILNIIITLIPDNIKKQYIVHI